MVHLLCASGDALNKPASKSRLYLNQKLCLYPRERICAALARTDFYGNVRFIFAPSTTRPGATPSWFGKTAIKEQFMVDILHLCNQFGRPANRKHSRKTDWNFSNISQSCTATKRRLPRGEASIQTVAQRSKRRNRNRRIASHGMVSRASFASPVCYVVMA